MGETKFIHVSNFTCMEKLRAFFSRGYRKRLSGQQDEALSLLREYPLTTLVIDGKLKVRAGGY